MSNIKNDLQPKNQYFIVIDINGNKHHFPLYNLNFSEIKEKANEIINYKNIVIVEYFCTSSEIWIDNDLMKKMKGHK